MAPSIPSTATNSPSHEKTPAVPQLLHGLSTFCPRCRWHHMFEVFTRTPDKYPRSRVVNQQWQDVNKRSFYKDGLEKINGQGGPGLRYLPTHSSNTSKCRTVGATSVISTVCELQVINVSPDVISLAKHRSLRFEGCSLTRTVIKNLNYPQLIVNWSHVSWPTFEQPKHWSNPSLPVFIGHQKNVDFWEKNHRDPQACCEALHKRRDTCHSHSNCQLLAAVTSITSRLKRSR